LHISLLHKAARIPPSLLANKRIALRQRFWLLQPSTVILAVPTKPDRSGHPDFSSG